MKRKGAPQRFSFLAGDRIGEGIGHLLLCRVGNLFEPISFGSEGPALFDLLTDEQKAQWNPVAVVLKAGSCTFHHGLTFHYTNANTTRQTRRALVTIYIPEEITYAAEEKMDNPFSETITSQKGEPLRGTRFPRLA